MSKLFKFKSIIRMSMSLVLALAVFLVPINYVLAVTASTSEINALNNKLKQTQQQKSSKQTQATELKNQVAIVNTQIDQAQASINQTQSQIRTTQKNIDDLDKKIQEEQSNLDREQEKMSQVIASWYMEGNSGLLEAMIGANNLSDLLDKQQYYESIRQQIQTNAERIQAIKNELSAQKNEQGTQLQMLNGLKSDQVSQQDELESKKSFKSRLLNDTTNALSDLTKQETDLRRRIDEMTAALSAAYTGGVKMQGGDIIPSVDPSWYQTQLGNPTTFYYNGKPNPDPRINVNNYGCYITSLAMMATFYGHNISNTNIATSLGNFDREGYLMGFFPPGLGISLGPLESVNQAKLNSELDSGHPVIATVRLDSFRGKRHPNVDGSDHFIVIKSRSGNKYYMHDPAQGKGYRFSDLVSIKTVRP